MPCTEYSFGHVYAMTNAVENAVVVYARNYLGELIRLSSYPTGGAGTGDAVVDPLGSQNALIVSEGGDYLFAVNAGDNTVSSFRIKGDSLVLTDTNPSGGVRPVSLASRGRLIFVANAGDANNASNISVLALDQCDFLRSVPGGTYALSEAFATPASLAFSRCADVLVASERNTNRLSAYTLGMHGTLSGPVVTPSSGTIPFGSQFLHYGVLLVTEAGPNALSSYDAQPDGTLTVISGTVLNGQSATCWVSATPDARNAYTSNAGSGSITRYQILDSGTLVVLGSETSTPDGAGAPTDSAIDKRGRNLYVLNGNLGSISVFDILQNGDIVLRQLFTDTGLPAVGAQGLAIRG